MQKYIKIQNMLYGSDNEPEISYIRIIKPIGFSILSLLLYLQENNTAVINCNGIMKILNIDKRTCKKYLSILQNNNLIECDESLKDVRVTTELIINLKKYNNLSKSDGFEFIPTSIFADQYKNIKSVGWLLLCFITKNYNNNFGSISDTGFANISEEYMSKHLGVSLTNIKRYLNILSKQKLIKIIPKKNIFMGYDENNKEIYSYVSNKYKISFKSNNKIKK